MTVSMGLPRNGGVPAGTRKVARAVFPKGCLATRIRDRLGEVFSDEEFREAFGERGRPGISPGQLALVSVLQFMENLTDRQAAHAVRSRIDVKYLLGLELTDCGFDFTVLTGFRQRLLDHDLDERVLDVVLERLAGEGLVSAGGRQRTDSTHVLAAIRRLNRLEFVGETLRGSLEALAAADPQWLMSWMNPEWQRRYGARVDAYRLPSERAERDRLARQIAGDGYCLLEAVHAPAAPGWLREIPAVSVLRTVWIQQFTRTLADGVDEVDWRGAQDLPPGRALVASPYDPEARYSHKRGSTWTGYKVHLSEDCTGTERPHLITHVVTTPATANDATVVDALHDALTAKGLKPAEHLLDSGYSSAELLLTAPAERGIDVIAPARPNGTAQQTRSTGYGKSAFTIDWQEHTATCPSGQTSRYWTAGLDNNGRDAIRIRFATATCAPCPVRSQCTRSTQYGRQLTVRPELQDALLERIRAEQTTETWKQRYAARAGIEGTIHQAVAVSGMRRTRFRGLAKTHLCHVLTATAINLMRLDAWWNDTPLAPTRTSRLAALKLTA